MNPEPTNGFIIYNEFKNEGSCYILFYKHFELKQNLIKNIDE